MQNLQPGAYVEMGADYGKTKRNYRKKTTSTFLVGGGLGASVDKANTSQDMMKSVIINQNTNQNTPNSNTPNSSTPNDEVVLARAYLEGHAGVKQDDLTLKANAEVANNWVINDGKTDQFVSFGLGLNAEYNIPENTGKGRFSTRKNDSGVTLAAGVDYKAPVTAIKDGDFVVTFGAKISIKNPEHKSFNTKHGIFEVPKSKRRKW
jgi:hypothetical protein